MKILFIGGKRFAGYHMVKEALAHGHEVVLFNRGKTSPELFPELETITGDREHDLGRLGGRKFDAVFDPGCYFPRHMRTAAKYFADKTEHYFIISTVSVYPLDKLWINEESELVPAIYDYETSTVTGENYGGMKAAIEQIASEAFGEKRLSIVRPGYICGYRDNTDRFSYWPVKMHYQNTMLSPKGDFDFQFVDARDLAAFSLKLVENRVSGAFNVTGPKVPFKFSAFLEECRAAINPNCKIIELDDAELEKLGLNAPSLSQHFPLITRGFDEYAGIFNIDVSKAVNAGLTFRPAGDTARAALEWHLETGVGEDGLAVGLKASRERELIAKL